MKVSRTYTELTQKRVVKITTRSTGAGAPVHLAGAGAGVGKLQ